MNAAMIEGVAMIVASLVSCATLVWIVAKHLNTEDKENTDD